MSQFDFDSIQTTEEYQWPKRGRKKEPIPDGLVKALHNSYETGATANMVLREDQVVTFGNLLNKAGKELNYRINRNITDSADRPGYKIYYFKAVSLRRQED